MICYVDIEHLKVYRDPDERVRRLAGILDIKYKLEEISGRPCLVQHYTSLSGSMLRDLGVEALFISGNSSSWLEYGQGEDSLAEMMNIIRAAERPIFGFCGGLQLIALAHGAPVELMGPLAPGQPDPHPDYAPGQRCQAGFCEVSMVEDDPVLEGLGSVFTVMEMHSWQVEAVPEGFELLATSPDCRVQLLKRTGKPVYGSQFHPEAFTDHPGDVRSGLVFRAYPQGLDEVRTDGRKILENFCRLAGLS